MNKDLSSLSYMKSFINTTPFKKDKNDRSRFLGEGISYKAKLIGILEVSEARGDRMCQEALADLKMAIRAAGEHKQRININIAIDGLRLKDEKTGDCLYHHPVHKISFIAQDMTDSRAFGYIFGSPDTGHRFFGIKTDKAASQVVISMRDLFQVVFELKKKEIEMAKQHIEQHQMKYSFPLDSHLTPTNNAENVSSTTKAAIEPLKMLCISDEQRKDDPGDSSQRKVVDLLLDLELELTNIHQGISQMIKITPCEPFGCSSSSVKLDPFEDSFNPVPVKAKLPPPPETCKRVKSTESQWLEHDTDALFEEKEKPATVATAPTSLPTPPCSLPPKPNTTSATISTFASEEVSKRSESPKESFDVFTDLDPLGTGRSRPYVDKKDFFQDLKNPPKKLLKDLVSESPLDIAPNARSSVYSPPNNSSKSDSEPESVSNSKTTPSISIVDPFNVDPFDKDPFIEDVSQVSIQSFSCDDPFEKFADFTSFDPKKKSPEIQRSSPSLSNFKADKTKHTPLKVSLPPEKLSTENSVSSPTTSRRSSKLHKYSTVSSTSIKLPSPKQKNRKIYSQIPNEGYGECLSSGLSQEFDKLSSDAGAPEPPPRNSYSSIHVKPPPLPPKKLISSSLSKQPSRLAHGDYDYIENYQTTPYSDFNSPPLPAPARKLKNDQKNSSSTEYYLQPFPLLPPPKKKVSPKTSGNNDSSNVSVPMCPTKSLDITLSQLTKTGFSDLAASLNMSPTSLSKMTLQDLTKCLSSLSTEIKSEDSSSEQPNHTFSLKSEAEAFDQNDNTSFSAEFDAHFGVSSSSVVNEESLFDKYAVFRELVEQEQKLAQNTQQEDEICSKSVVDQQPASQANELVEKALEDPKCSKRLSSSSNPSEDRYAALRDICLDEAALENDEADNSDKDDSVVEASHLEEDTDLLPSHPHSESTDSPTITMKEHQSVMETTIIEEDVSALEADDDEVPDETMNDTLNEHEVDQFEKIPEIMKEELNPSGNIVESNVIVDADYRSGTSWAKFDNVSNSQNKVLEKRVDGNTSPWSAESKENDISPPTLDKKKYSRNRRQKLREEDDEDDDDDDDDDDDHDDRWNVKVEPRSWSPSWRENGWSDVDSLCDDNPPYMRDYHSSWKGRRRRVSPWNSREQSPWEDDHDLSEDQWEDNRWAEDTRQRLRFKGPSWEDERSRHYDDVRKSRKQMVWSSDIDRKSSRESLTWEDDERYSKRNYMDRRHRKWDDDGHGRHRKWRERDRTDLGKKMGLRYYRERLHDHQWDDDYNEKVNDDLNHWPQRPRSCDRIRRQYSSHHSSEIEFSDRRYIRPPREEYSNEGDYRRRAQTLQLQKSRRRHNNPQSSPFEDDFSSQFSYSKDFGFSGSCSDVYECDVKQPVPSDFRQKHSFIDNSKSVEYSQFSSSSNRDEDAIPKNNTARCCQQSPFEDDFTPPETRRCSGRSVSSDLSDTKSGDDVFYGEPKDYFKSKYENRRPRMSAPSDPPNKVGSSTFAGHSHLETSRQKVINKDREKELKTETPHQYAVDKRAANLKRSDSSSSLKKSESVNIFARNRDPFDDDFFSESGLPSSEPDKNKSSFVESSKWNDTFNSFSFDDESK